MLASVLAIGAVTFAPQVNRATMWLFIGLSMLLAGIRGYSGCELLALPNTVLRRNIALWCPIHTPIYAAEQRRHTMG